MKKQKFLIVSLFMLVLFVLVGCSSSNKKESALAKYYADLAGQKQSQIDFNVKINSVSGIKAGSNTEIMNKLLETSNISGNIATDGTNVQGEINLNVNGSEVPFKYLGNQKELYMSTDFVSPGLNLISSLSGNKSQANVKSLDGKYLDLSSSLENTSYISKKDQAKINSVAKESPKLQKDLAVKLEKYVNSLPSDTVIEKNDKVTVTLHKSEVKSFLVVMNDFLKDHPELNLETMKDKDLNDVDKDFSKFDVKLVYDEKTKLVEYTVDAKDKDNRSINITFSTKVVPFNKNITMPAKKNIITEDQFEAAIDGLSTSFK